MDFRPNHAPLVPPGGIDCHTRDMTATISADMTLQAVQARLAEIGQWLPVDGDPSHTVGHLVSTNSTGPMRLGFGAWRDLLLGCQFLNGRGELITAGGRTVKNVAGYDLTKFMVGQCGVFGRIVTVTTRTYRRPDGAVIARAEVLPVDGSVAKMVSVLNTSSMRPQWIMQVKSDELICGHVGDELALAYYASANPPFTFRSRERISLADEIALRAKHWAANLPGQGRRVFRGALPPCSFSWPDHLCTSWAADPMFGIIVGQCEARHEVALKQQVEQLKGTITFFDEQSQPDALPPGLRGLLARLKSALDPDNTLAPLPA